MKSVLISVKPKYCELIASGQKTVEVRKSKPKLETPFKCYIYCTKEKDYTELLWTGKNQIIGKFADKSNCKVIGEFVCDKIYHYSSSYGRGKAVEDLMDISDEEMERQSCLSQQKLNQYENSGNNHRWGLLGWHISNLKIYDKPKELREFYNICPEWEKERITNKCHKCPYLFKNDSDMCYQCSIEGEKHIKRPPQSWCYVEELEVK